MDPTRVARLTIDQRLDYACEFGWLPSRRRWSAAESVWWVSCRETASIHIRGIAHDRRVLVIADSLPSDRRLGRDAAEVFERLRKMDVPGDIELASLERVHLRRVPLDAMTEVVAILHRLVDLHAADVVMRRLW